MKRRRILACTAAALLPASATMADIYIIANPALQLTPDEAREVFVGDKQLAGSVKIVPFDNAAAQAEFLDKVYHMDAAKYSTLWAKKGFRDGLNAPAVKGTDVEVIAAVKSTPGAIGYVTAPSAGVTVIRKY
jgi:ABC-type phosphate transport system substrate-binding protein